MFPEECITGSVNKSELADDAVLAAIDSAAELAVPRLEALCRELGMTAVVGTVERRGDRRFNSALIVGPDGYLATYDKMWLPGGEREYFEPGATLPVIHSQGWRLSRSESAPTSSAATTSGWWRRRAPSSSCSAWPGAGCRSWLAPDGDQTKQAEAHRALHVKLMRRWSAQSGLYIFYANQAGKSGPAWFPGLVLITDPHGELVPSTCRTEGMVVTEVSRGALAAACPTRPEEDAAGGPVNSAGEAVAVRAVVS